MLLFSVVSDHISFTALSSLSNFPQLVLILIKLHLNVRQQDLAYRFNVSVSTVSRVFSALIDVLHQRLDSLVIWPEREELRKSMSMELRRHVGLRVNAIVDCFDVFVDRPTNLEARSITWSNCKPYKIFDRYDSPGSHKFHFKGMGWLCDCTSWWFDFGKSCFQYKWICGSYVC